MNIVSITPALASAASHLYATAWKAAYRGMIPQEYLDQLSPERWTPLLGQSSPDQQDFLLLEDGQPAAVSSICAARDPSMQGWGEIVSLYVHPDRFRRGYGRALLQHDLRQLAGMGFSRVYLCVLEPESAALSCVFPRSTAPSAHKAQKRQRRSGRCRLFLPFCQLTVSVSRWVKTISSLKSSASAPANSSSSQSS